MRIKLTCGLLLLFLLCNFACAQDYVKEGLVSYWSFDEGRGETTEDSAGKNHGKINGAAWVEGKKGQALYFDGTNDFVDCGNDPSLNITGDVTIEAWVKLSRDLKVEKSEEAAIMTKGPHNDAASYGLEVRCRQCLFTEGFLAGRFHQQIGMCKLSKNKWHHVALTRDSSGTKFYLNGYFDGESGITSGRVSSITAQIGARNAHYCFPGAIDEVRIYNRALSAEEIGKNTGEEDMDLKGIREKLEKLLAAN